LSVARTVPSSVSSHRPCTSRRSVSRSNTVNASSFDRVSPKKKSFTSSANLSPDGRRRRCTATSDGENEILLPPRRASIASVVYPAAPSCSRSMRSACASSVRGSTFVRWCGRLDFHVFLQIPAGRDRRARGPAPRLGGHRQLDPGEIEGDQLVWRLLVVAHLPIGRDHDV